MNNLWFTSDLHFYHINCIKYTNRPFNNIEHMHESLISNWNSNVKQKDVCYVLGDFAYLIPRDIPENLTKVLNRLNGHKHLILGNHDYKYLTYYNRINIFESITPLVEINYYKQKITLCHYPMLSWNNSHYNTSWQLFGHHHGRLQMCNNKQYDVGVDCNNFKPLCYEEIEVIMKEKDFKNNVISNC